jgi:hypothetical protein
MSFEDDDEAWLWDMAEDQSMDLLLDKLAKKITEADYLNGLIDIARQLNADVETYRDKQRGQYYGSKLLH